MKNLVSGLALFAFISTASAQSSIQMINSNELAPETNVSFSTVVTHTTITIESANGAVSTLELPKGVLYSVQVAEGASIAREERYRRTIKGDVVLRARRGDEVRENESKDAWMVMQQSPFQLALTDVTVTIDENIEPGFYPHE